MHRDNRSSQGHAQDACPEALRQHGYEGISQVDSEFTTDGAKMLALVLDRNAAYVAFMRVHECASEYPDQPLQAVVSSLPQLSPSLYTREHELNINELNITAPLALQNSRKQSVREPQIEVGFACSCW
jgi:hypothetical protein